MLLQLKVVLGVCFPCLLQVILCILIIFMDSSNLASSAVLRVSPKHVCYICVVTLSSPILAVTSVRSHWSSRYYPTPGRSGSRATGP